MLNNDMLRQVMLFCTIDINYLFFMTNHFAYRLGKDLYYWKTKFKMNQLPILSYDFHQSYPSNTYEWIKEYRLVTSILSRINQWWCKDQFSLVVSLSLDDDLSWLPDLFYNNIMNVDEEYEEHALHILICKNIGTINYHYYDDENDYYDAITEKTDNAQLLVTSMLYHLSHVCIVINQ